jgi:signal transduction histidine kinase
MGLGMELTGRRRDGSEVPVEVSLTNVRAGDETMTIGMIADVTQRVEMEEHNRQTHKMEALGQLAGTVADQLNAFLSVISRCAAMGLDGCNDTGASRSSLEELSRTAAKAASLAQQLYIFSGSQAVEPVWFDPNTRLSQMYHRLIGLVGEHIHLELALGEDIGELLADPRHWDQVIVNLVQNACDAMPEGGRLRIETSSAEVGEKESRWYLPVSPGMYVMLTVADTGVGMTPEVQSRMFEPFFSAKPPGHGAGTGLSTVYGILMAAGGSIRASSEPEQGAVFQVIFPRLAAASSGRNAGGVPSGICS